jgi:rod shape determining protein RodA
MNTFLFYFKKFDWILIASAVLLVGFGLLSLYSSSVGRGDFLNFHKQIIFFALGFFFLILFSNLDFRILRTSPYLILGFYFFCLAALAGLFFFAPEIRGVKSWYKFGPVSLDPIEFAKIILIILLAKYFSIRHIEMYRIRHILLSGFYVLLPCVLIFFQPDLGSVLILLILWFGILFISGIKLRHFLVLCLTGFLLFGFGWSRPRRKLPLVPGEFLVRALPRVPRPNMVFYPSPRQILFLRLLPRKPV